MSDTRSYRDIFEARGLDYFAPALVVGVRCEQLTSGDSVAASLRTVERVVIARGENGCERTTIDGVRTLHLRIADEWMSAPHATLEKGSDGEWTVRDNRSKNGTRIRGTAVNSERLCDGDWIEVGSTFVLFQHERRHHPEMPNDLWNYAQYSRPLSTLSPELKSTFRRVHQVAQSDLPVLILGETGTGKEVVARAIHEMSQRRGNFVALNCAALPETLAESELFGCVKGAFSGADRDRDGLVRGAHEGTLFLDEFGELGLPLQAKLLRVLQFGEVTPLGSNRTQSVDVRVVAATNRNVDDEVSISRFRADLLARIAGFRVELPRLDERQEDLGLLIGRILRELGKTKISLDRSAGRALTNYNWPKNIRELEQTLRTAIALAAPDTRITLEHLPTFVVENRRQPDDMLPSHLEQLLRQHEGNVSAVARDMGKARVQIRRWCKRFGFDPELYRS